MADAKVIKNGAKSGSSQVYPLSMLEILSVTDAAVKALNKSTHSPSSTSSKGSVKLHHSEAPRGTNWSEKSQNGNQCYKNKGLVLGIAAQNNEQQDNSFDSGIIKTCTTSENTRSSKGKAHQNGIVSEAEHHDKSSDESTTASDVLIRSTLADQPDRSLHEVDMSVTSKCSKTSFGMDNFNSSGPQKVKIAAKHLREIKSPLEDDRSSQASGDSQSYQIVQISGTGKEIMDKPLPREAIHGAERGRSDPNKISSSSRNGEVNSKSHSQRNENRNSQNFQENEKVARYKEEKVRKEETLPRNKTSAYSNGENEKTLSKANHINSIEKPEADGDKNGSHKLLPREITEKRTVHVHDQKDEKGQHTEADKEDKSGPLKCTSKYYIERHTPKKNVKDGLRKNMKLPEKKNLLQELEDSVDIIPQKEGHDSSSNSSQPEIVTVPERIVTVSARTSVSPSPLGRDNDSLVNTPPALEWQQDRYRKLESPYAAYGHPGQVESHASIEEEGHDKQQGRFYFSRGHYLKQGAPVSGAEAPDQLKGQDDVQISQFKLTEKQRLAKGALANRNNNAGPVKRKVQPKFISRESNPGSSGTSIGMMKPQENIGQTTEAITAAVAASAAVAATQPFLKAQSDLEAKMAQILNKMTEGQGGQGTEHQKLKTSEEESERVKALEKQLHDLTEKRIEYLENLQQQQIAMQAHLLSLTRDVPSSKYTRSSTAIRSPSRSPEPQKKQYTVISQPKKAFSKTTVSKAAPCGNYGEKKHVSRVDVEESSPLDTPAPRSRAPKPVAFDSSDIVTRSRTHSPQRTNKDRGILEQILDYAGSPGTEKTVVEQRSRSPVREPRSFEIPQVQSHDTSSRKANEIVNEISSLKKQIKGLVSDAEQLKNYTRETSPISVRTASYIPKDIHYGPSPLDPYLELPESGVESPYKSVPDLEPIRFNAPLLPGFKDAEGILRQVQKSRGYLEANLETVIKARQETEVYSLLQALYHDSSDQERIRIKHLVDEKVAKMRKEIEREVTDERVWEEINKKKSLQVPGAAKPMPTPISVKPYSWGTQRQGTATAAKADSGLSKQTAAVMNRRPAGKENIPQRPKPQVRPKQRSPFEDEEYMTHVYGKALYQKGRTTVKAPYIHLQNVPKQKPSRPKGVQEVRGVEVKSSKAQTAPVVKQYYFNPTDGTYIPVSVASGAPIQGQLIQMAVPLGEPRLDPGLKMPTSTSIPSGPMSSAHRVVPPTAARNVTLVSLPTELPKKEQHIPELGKQVLPAVDIDTDMSDILEVTEPYLQSAMSAERTRSLSRSPKRTRSPPKSPKKTRLRSPSPPKVKAEKMVHVESPAQSPTKAALGDTVPIENDQAQEEVEETYVEEEDADVESATGIELPGYQAPEPPLQQQRKPEFPPRPFSGDRQMTSDIIAEDIRRRDALQNKAVEWIEQELMAQIITELFPLRQQEEPPEISHVVSEESEESMAEDKEEAVFIMDSIGRGGLQLFVDAGMPVNNDLVQDLVREVVTEKIRTMLGQKPEEESGPQAASRLVTTTNQADMREPQPESWEQHLSRQVRTPEPTPKQSPASSPPRRISPPVTPEASPRFETVKPEPVFVMPEPIHAPAQVPEVRESESEPESSVSFDIKEELQRLAGELIVQEDISVTQIYDVATPPASPKPEPPPVEEFQLPTPPMLSPRLAKKEPPETAKPVEKKPESPQPWSSPESPRPEENPEFTERDQPKPMEFRTLPRDEMPVIQQTEAEKPLSSPVEPVSKARPSSPPTESESITESTQSDTINEIISEGQWFLDKSEGEVAEFQIDEIARQRLMAQTTRRKVDASTASTLKDTEDLDLLEEPAEMDRSDGEFIYRTPVAPEDDPILNLLAKLQHQSQYQPVVYGQYEMSPNRVQQLLKASGKSVGEVTLHGTVRSEGEIFGGDPRISKEHIMYPDRRFPEPQRRRESPTRVSFDANRQLAEYDRPLRDSTILDGDMPQEDIEIPESDTGRKTPTGRVTPGGRQLQGRSITVSAGGRASPVKSALKRPPKVTRSGSIPEMRGSRLVQVRSSSEDLGESQENYSGYEGITYGSRAMTPDQMNLDSLIQSGYLSQSFSQSENGKLGQSGLSGGAASLKSSLRSSTEFHHSSPNRMMGGRNSLGLTYSMETYSSINEEVMHQPAGSGTLKMKVTIPNTSDQEDQSDISEIDITDGNTR
ncbi:hypothetical protein CHS0354_034588 [Potamilus streckersoni]|uniref:Protein TALPID3 n=1 Tax=Potamilus streckersoni TaxID=2493646 RepID=A0AAE0W203_9BIVA|nr:hypothetical protein CHS0354_034588 [Potamilus streckersoni]